MQLIQKSGLVIFLIGFGIFLASFFMESYTLTNDIVTNKLGNNESSSALMNELKPFIGGSYANSFSFVSKMNDSFEKVNEQQIKKYANIK